MSNFCRCSQPTRSRKSTLHLPIAQPVLQVLDLTTTQDRPFTTLLARLLQVNTLPLVVGRLGDTVMVHPQHSCALLSRLFSPNQSRQAVSSNLTIHSKKKYKYMSHCLRWWRYRLIDAVQYELCSHGPGNSLDQAPLYRCPSVIGRNCR